MDNIVLESFIEEGRFQELLDYAFNQYDLKIENMEVFETAIFIARYWLENEAKLKGSPSPLDCWDNFIREIYAKHPRAKESLLIKIKRYIMRKIYALVRRHSVTPDDKNPFGNKISFARVLYGMEEMEAALSFLIALTRHYPKYSEPWGIIGKIYFSKREYEKSLLCYREAFFINPSVLNLMEIKSEIIDNIIDFFKNNYNKYEENLDNQDLLQWIGIYGVIGNFFKIRRQLEKEEEIELDMRIEAFENKYKNSCQKTDFLSLIRLYVYKIDYYKAMNNLEGYLPSLKKLEIIEPIVYKKIKLLRG